MGKSLLITLKVCGHPAHPIHQTQSLHSITEVAAGNPSVISTSLNCKRIVETPRCSFLSVDPGWEITMLHTLRLFRIGEMELTDISEKSTWITLKIWGFGLDFGISHLKLCPMHFSFLTTFTAMIKSHQWHTDVAAAPRKISPLFYIQLKRRPWSEASHPRLCNGNVVEAEVSGF